MHKAIERFKDTNGEIYEAGDVYPHDGLKPATKTRLKQLLTEKNKVGRPFIVEVEEPVPDTPEPMGEHDDARSVRENDAE